MRWRFRTQVILTVIIIIAFNFLSTVFEHWIFRSIGFGICGLLYLVHPVVPQNAPNNKQMVLAVRIAGIILILIGIFTRSYVY